MPPCLYIIPRTKHQEVTCRQGSIINIKKSNSYWCTLKKLVKIILSQTWSFSHFLIFFLTRTKLTCHQLKKVLNVPKKNCVRIFIIENVAFWASVVGYESRIRIRIRIQNFGKYWVRLGVCIRKNKWVLITEIFFSMHFGFSWPFFQSHC
jgi:hypothetical protein